MGEPAVTSVRSKWLVLIVILIIAALGITVIFWTGMFFPRKIEKIYFGSCEWSDDITEADLHIANTGADELVIAKVWINGTLLDSTEWESFPSMRFQPGDQGVLHITPSLIVFKEGSIYQFTISTVAGNSFSYTAIAKTDSQMQQAGVILVLENVRYYSSTGTAKNRTDIVIRNTGTADAKISAVYWSSAGYSALQHLTSGTDYSLSSSTISVGSTSTITIYWASTLTTGGAWSVSITYYYKVVTETGQYLEFSKKSPAS